jgi:cysteine desulfurase / selenocysteine lyase
MDVLKIRGDFPILSQKIHGKDLVYLDNAATTQKPQQVLDAMNYMYTKINANIHRGVHFLSEESTTAHEDARKNIAHFIHAQNPYEIIFTRGTTESINLVASSFGEAFIHENDEILVTEMEHHSNFVPWQMLANRKSAKFKVLKFENDASISLEKLKSAINDRTKILAITHVSNALGTINPIRKIIEIAHSAGVPVLIDAAQSIQHLPIDVQALDCDFLVFSGHKIYGPTGIGVLYGKEKWLEQMPPYQFGGEMISSVSIAETTFNELPFKFEAGTPNYVATIGLESAIKYLSQFNFKDISHHEHDLLMYAEKLVSQIEGVNIYSRAPQRSSVLSFLVDGIHPYDLGTMLDKTGVALRTGTHCAETVMQHYNISGTIRASFAIYNTKSEVDYFIQHLNKIIQILRG